MSSSWKDLGSTAENQWEPDAESPDLTELEPVAAEKLGHRTALVDGASLCEAVRRYISDYLVLGEEQLVAATLFVLHTWSFESCQTTPYLIVMSPLWQTGKTRLLEVLEQLVAAPMRADDISGPALFRTIEANRPTLLLDELDVLFGARGDRAESLRHLLNAGNRVGGVATRCVPPSWDVRDFSVFCPKVLAGIDNGRWPNTLLDRSVILRTKRRKPDEQVTPFRFAEAHAAAAPMRELLEAWGEQNLDQLREARPQFPDGLSDRAADAWEPLFAIADVVGPTWASDARRGALELYDRQEQLEDSPQLTLLADIRAVFEATAQQKLASVSLCAELRKLPEARWSHWGAQRGKPGLSPSDLAFLLRPFGIRPHVIRLNATSERGSTAKGYTAEDFQDTWARYLSDAREEEQ